ncbi:glycoside hydrolase, family 27, partial [Kipferlia bialata]
MLETARALNTTGLVDAGYEYLVLDDCWQAETRTPDGSLQSDPERFPHGLLWLSEQVAEYGLKLGAYTDYGTQTCQERPGSLGHYAEDAQFFADNNIQYLKVDTCHTQDLDPRVQYPLFQQALIDTGAPILFSMCNWGLHDPWEWAQDVANMWRIGFDIQAWWFSIDRVIGTMRTLGPYSEPSAWNDPDMLEVGVADLSE